MKLFEYNLAGVPKTWYLKKVKPYVKSSDDIRKLQLAYTKTKEKFFDYFKNKSDSTFKFKIGGDSAIPILPNAIHKYIILLKSIELKVERKNYHSDHAQKLADEVGLAFNSYFKFDLERQARGLYRIHFPDGIPAQLRGIGLGYSLYISLIEQLGVACSAQNASTEAKRVYVKMIKDDIFYAAFSKGAVILFSKKLNEDQIIEYLKSWLDAGQRPGADTGIPDRYRYLKHILFTKELEQLFGGRKKCIELIDAIYKTDI